MSAIVLDKATRYAQEKLKSQKYNGLPYIFHCQQVAMIIGLLFPNDSDLYQAAVLHDILENTDTSYEELKKEFGVKVANLVTEVTKTDYNTFPNLHSKKGVILKFADRLCNLANMDNWSKEQQDKYIQKSKFWKV